MSFFRKTVLLTFITGLFSCALSAQQLVLVLSDSLTNNALPYVNLYLEKTGIGASTNNEGIAKFEINSILPNDTLHISYIGYQKKHIAIPQLNSTTTLEIKLSPEAQLLNVVEIHYQKQKNPEQIIKEALKNTEINYPNKEVLYNALYRETVQEDSKYIQLDEAFIQVNYSGYPQKNLDHTIWKDWYYDDSYSFELEGNYFFSPLLEDFNTKVDRQTIIASRKSQNHSQYGNEITLIGDPLLLFAFDKIKYQYDFLNPSVINKYHLQLESSETINDEECYVISFYPEKTNRDFIIDLSRKNKSAIYIGRMYITKNTLALVKFKYSLAVDRDFGFFAKRIPLEYTVEMTYKKHHEKYFIDNIFLNETKSIGKNKIGESILYNAKKSVFITSHNLGSFTPIADSAVFKSTRFSSIRYYYNNYNPSFWTNNPLLDSLAPPSAIVKDLEQETPLQSQFASYAIEENTIGPAPIAPKQHHSFTYHNTSINDSLHWMANIESEQQLKKYLSEENNYAKDQLVSSKRLQKKLFTELNQFNDNTETKEEKIKPGNFFFNIDSLDQFTLQYQQDSLIRNQVFNLTEFDKFAPNAQIQKLVPAKNKEQITIQYSKVGIPGDFLSIHKYNSIEPLCTINQIDNFHWLNNTILLFTKTDNKGRAGELYMRSISNQMDSLIYSEPDSTFDIELLVTNETTFCTIQSKTENEIFRIKNDNSKISLELIKSRKDGVYNELEFKNGIYVLEKNASTPNTFLYSTLDNPTSFQQVGQCNKDEYIQDFLVMPNYIIALVYDNSIPKLKSLNIETQKWNDLDIKLGLGVYELQKETQDSSFTFYFSSPSQPWTRYQYNIFTQKLKEISRRKIDEYAYSKNVSKKRVWVKSHDGVKIPMTILQNHNNTSEQAGVILRVYGAYGANTTPSFSEEDAVLLSNGFIIAIAHVRGESILGSAWYEQGRLFNKRNSIEDYIACAEYLIKKKIAHSDNLIGYGNSAGGIVVAQAINERPELFQTIILDNPYLDVINTMMNDSLPLTIDEYKEWGNPNQKEVFDYIMTYSPYQNIRTQNYPNVIVFAGYQDYQTPIWQTAKYVAKLRDNNLSNSDILFITDMNSGHSGNTTGKEWIKVFSQKYGFVYSRNRRSANG